MGSKGSKPKVPSITFNFASPPATDGTQTSDSSFGRASFVTMCVCACGTDGKTGFGLPSSCFDSHCYLSPFTTKTSIWHCHSRSFGRNPTVYQGAACYLARVTLFALYRLCSVLWCIMVLFRCFSA